MKGSTKGFPDRRKLILSVFLLSMAVFVRPAYPGWCEVKIVAVTKATVQDPNPEHVIYGIEGQYGFSEAAFSDDEYDAACPSGVINTSVKGEWINPKGVGVGTANEDFGYVHTSSKCAKNPWISQDAGCTQIYQKVDKNMHYEGPAPPSASVMSSAQKQTLLQLQMAKVASQNLLASVKSGPLYETLSPKWGQQFGGDVSIHVKFRPDMGAKIKSVNLTLTNIELKLSVLRQIAITNNEAKMVIPRSNFEKYPGEWRVAIKPHPDLFPTYIIQIKILPTVPAIHLKK